MRRRTLARVLALSMVVAAPLVAARSGAAPKPQAEGPIRHIVFVMEENHSFDDVFGKFCAEVSAGDIVRAGLNEPCHGAISATLSDGTTRPLSLEQDSGLVVDHSVGGQKKVIDGGRMDGWDTDGPCRPQAKHPYVCLAQFDPLHGTCGAGGTQNCTSNLDLYAERYAMSDRTFEFRATPSWAGHMVLGSASVEQFMGANPKSQPGGPEGGLGWGCDSGKSTQWFASGRSGAKKYIPSCIPDRAGSLGPTWAGYGGTRAQYVPTLFDRMDAAGVPWRIYYHTTATSDPAVGWAICPTFWECQGSSQAGNAVDDSAFFDAAANGLPAVSFVIPSGGLSAHQPAAMSKGDAWVGRVVDAVMNGPSWSSTAIFISFDDCGCFYDDVNPLQYSPDWGPRVPMLIVSPYARAGYTDSTPATSVSVLAFIEKAFGLTPLHPCATVDSWDPHCTDDVQDYNGQPTYDFSQSFDFSGPRAGRVRAVRVGMPPGERAWLRAHPHAGDAPT